MISKIVKIMKKVFSNQHQKLLPFFEILVIMYLISLILQCKRENPDNNFYELLGSWKFTAFGSSNNSLRTVNPIDCEVCYLLTFNEDSTINGKSVINILGGQFILSSNQLRFPNGVLATEVLEEGDPYSFTEALKNVNSFKIENRQLKLFYTNNDFLLLNLKTN